MVAALVLLHCVFTAAPVDSRQELSASDGIVLLPQRIHSEQREQLAILVRIVGEDGWPEAMRTVATADVGQLALYEYGSDSIPVLLDAGCSNRRSDALRIGSFDPTAARLGSEWATNCF